MIGLTPKLQRGVTFCIPESSALLLGRCGSLRGRGGCSHMARGTAQNLLDDARVFVRHGSQRGPLLMRRQHPDRLRPVVVVGWDALQGSATGCGWLL